MKNFERSFVIVNAIVQRIARQFRLEKIVVEEDVAIQVVLALRLEQLEGQFAQLSQIVANGRRRIRRVNARIGENQRLSGNFAIGFAVGRAQIEHSLLILGELKRFGSAGPDSQKVIGHLRMVTTAFIRIGQISLVRN